MEFIFYKDNKISGEHHKTVSEIIKDYNKSEISKLELPFDRKILNFMMTEYGSFDVLSEDQWKELYNENKKQKK